MYSNKMLSNRTFAIILSLSNLALIFKQPYFKLGVHKTLNHLEVKRLAHTTSKWVELFNGFVLKQGFCKLLCLKEIIFTRPLFQEAF